MLLICTPRNVFWARVGMLLRRFLALQVAAYTRRGCATDDVFDVTSSLAEQVRAAKQRKSIEGLIAELLPPAAPQEAATALRAYFDGRPINECIEADEIMITHVGGEARRLPPMPLDAALEAAREQELDLVQMAASVKDGKRVAFCRIRDERTPAMESVKHLLGAASGGSDKSEAVQLRALNIHSFSDVCDAHFIGWRSKKIVVELKKRHPVKLVIERFTSAAGALEKMRAMLAAIEEHAKETAVIHHHTGITVSERELSVSLSPDVTASSHAKGIRHPKQADWQRAQRKFEELGLGTAAPQRKGKRRG